MSPPTPEYPVTRPGERQAPSVLAVHCSEGRFLPAFDELLARVGSPEADHISVPGGPWWLAEASRVTQSRLARIAASRVTSARQALERLVREGGVRRVVLLGHQDCAWYAQLDRSASRAALIQRQGQDLLRARDAVVEAAGSNMAVSGHILTFDEDGARFRTLFQ